MSVKRSLLLLVDDESSILQTMRRLFEEEGYEVATAGGSAEALEYLQDNGNIDVLITDLNMEAEDIGLEVARAAQRLRPKPAVVICTGYANLSNSRSALDMGVDYLALKPVEPTELIGAVKRLVLRRSHARDRV
ncbi:MAG TPA: response regulator [Terriglobales bacterium]|nr:response regulator [Terriglobales bacterium]